MASTNLFSRLRALLPQPPVWVGEVLEHNADGTSTVQLPSSLTPSELGPGLSAGATLRVRGTSVGVGERAFIRDGVVESAAPAGAVAEAVIGQVAALPFGPERLARGPDVVAPAAALGVAYSLALAPAWTGGYSPRAYALTAGALPPGLALDAATGVISGTRTGGGAAAGLVVTCTDSTRRALASNSFSIAA